MKQALLPLFLFPGILASPLAVNDLYTIPSDVVQRHIATAATMKPVGEKYYFRNGEFLTASDFSPHDQALIASGNASELVNVSWSFTALDIAGAVAVVAGGVCVFYPGCPSYVAQNLRNAGIASISAGAGGGGIDLEGGNRVRRLARRTDQYEGWACEYQDGSDSYCEDPDTVQSVVNFIGMQDTPGDQTTQSPATSYWAMQDLNKPEGKFAYWWHCLEENGRCGMSDNGPSNLT
ncbi:MAG: hypothetical protein MMC23_001121 [Stictis urceolatum]|nr:hypothetical protein [Stictis urceolata]